MLVSSRATNILLVVMIAVGIGIVAMLASGVRGGPLDPPAAPAPTGVTQDLPACELRRVSDCARREGLLRTHGGHHRLRWRGRHQHYRERHLARPQRILGGRGGLGTGVRGDLPVQRLAISNGKVAGWVGNGVNVTNASESRFWGLQVSYNGGQRDHVGYE